MIQIRKVLEHVYEKLFGGADTISNPGTEREAPVNETEDIAALAQAKIDLFCNDQVCA